MLILFNTLKVMFFGLRVSRERPTRDRAFLIVQIYASHEENIDRKVGKTGAVTNSTS